MVFSIIVKLIDELLFQMIHYKNWMENGQKGVPILLNLNSNLLNVFRKTINNRLQVVWNWLHLIMDTTEAKLKFGNALTAALTNENISHNTSNQNDICFYFLSLLRSHSSESGDELPAIEHDALKAIVFVVEAYLFHINVVDQQDLQIQQLNETNEKNKQVLSFYDILNGKF